MGMRRRHDWLQDGQVEDAVHDVSTLKHEIAIVMPRLLLEDFAPLGQAKVAFQYLQHKLRGSAFLAKRHG